MPYTTDMFVAMMQPDQEANRGLARKRRTPDILNRQPNTQQAAATTMADYREPIAADKVFCTMPDIAANF